MIAWRSPTAVGAEMVTSEVRVMDETHLRASQLYRRSIKIIIEMIYVNVEDYYADLFTSSIRAMTNRIGCPEYEFNSLKSMNEWMTYSMNSSLWLE